MQRLPHPTSHEGQAVVEFTLIASILVVIVMAILQFGAVFSHYIDFSDAARAGARAAAASGGSSAYVGNTSEQTAATTAARAAVDAALGTLSHSPATLTLQSPCVSWAAGCDVKVTVQQPSAIETVSLLGFTVMTFQLSHSVTMRIQKH